MGLFVKMFRSKKNNSKGLNIYINYTDYKHTWTYCLRPVLYPGQEAQVKAARDLQQLQSLRGRAEGKGDLEAVFRVKHQLGGAVAILQHRLNFSYERRRHPLLEIVDGRVGVQNLHNLQKQVFWGVNPMLRAERQALRLWRTWTGLSSVHFSTISLASPSVDLLTCSSQAAWDSGLRVCMALELWRFRSFSHSSR